MALLSGLNVTDDDFSKKEGESPRLNNARLNGSKEPRKRAQSMSRLGQRFNGVPDGSEVTSSTLVGDEAIEVKEYRSVRFSKANSGRLTSVGLWLKTDTVDTNAYMLIILRDPTTHAEICRAVQRVSDLTDKMTHYWYRFIKTIDGNFELELTLVDDMNNSGTALGTVVKVAADGSANHEWSEHDVPNLDEALREEPYEYELGINQPVVSRKTTTWRPWNGWIQNDYFTKADGDRYIIIPVVNGSGQKEVYCQKYVETEKDGAFQTVQNQPITLLIPASKLNQSSTQVRMAQAGQYLFFVDGFSNLQRVDLTNDTIADAIPTGIDMFDFVPNTYYYKNSLIYRSGQFYRANADFQASDSFNASDWTAEGVSSLTAWPGASLIYFLNNRLFLSGFREATVGSPAKAEPNLVLMSSIDSVAPKYDMFNRQIEFFYVPDRAPAATSSSPVSAFSSLGDSLIVFMQDGLVFEQVTANVEYSGIAQVTPEGANYGVLKQEHVVKSRNNVLFLNPSLGMMRLGGSIASVISRPVDAIFKDIPEENYSDVTMSLHKDMLRVYYHLDGSGDNDSCLVDYTQYAQQKSYWYHDVNTPIKQMYSDSSYDTELGIGSEYPCVVEAEDTLRDFDCAIEYLYYTRYLGSPNRLDGLIVRRIHTTTLQDFNSSIYIGLDYDHNNKPIVWRRFITATEKGTFLPEDVFDDDQETGATNISIRILTANTHFCQIRLKQYCYDYQAEILQTGLEYGNAANL